MPNFDLTHFNPGSQNEADFLAGFIARQDVLQHFLKQLSNTADYQTAKPQLVIAPRGYGKTSLLRRINIALRDEAHLKARYIPLSFREEQHNVISLDVFWRNCLLSLCEAREDEGAPQSELDALDQMWVRYAPRSGIKREDQDGSPGWNAFSEYCRTLGRRPVLLIDNLDTMLAGLMDTHQWGLRTILQKPDGPVLFAAASRYPTALNDTKAAFFDFFRITTLQALSDMEVMTCLHKLATMRGDKGLPVLDMLENDPGRISALNTMAGGNPRTLGVLYTVLESHMSDDVLAQLSAMLDTFTGWYQARTEELPMQSRAVFDALALNWDPMTAAEISVVTGLDTPSVSSQLSRLEKSAYAEAVSQSKTKKGRNAYQVSERFFNIWYLMRNGSRHTRQKIRFLTIFLRSCFSRRELEGMAQDKLRLGAGKPESILAIAACLGNLALRDQLLATVMGAVPEYPQIDDMKVLVDGIYNTTKPRKGKLGVETKKPDNVFLMSGVDYIKTGKIVEAEIQFQKAIAADQDDFVTWVLLASCQTKLNKYAETEATYRKMTTIDPIAGVGWHFLGEFLLEHGERPEEALLAYEQILKLKQSKGIVERLTYLCALRLAKIEDARIYAKQVEPDFPPCAQHLMQAALAWGDVADNNAAYKGWQAFNLAVTSGDDALWTIHIDKLSQVLAFAVAHGDGSQVRKWMEADDYPSRYAPLYHAFCALLEGEDYLLLINPEVRGMAETIYKDLAKHHGIFTRKKIF